MENNEQNITQDQIQTPNNGAENKKLIGPIIIIILIIASLVVLLRLPTNKNSSFDFPTQADLNKAKNQQNIPEQKLLPTDHVRGNLNARIVIFEYSDLDCPFCARFHPTMKQIVSEYPNDVAWVYRHFPLDNLHPKARLESIASECVAKISGEEAFWSFIDNALAYNSSDVPDPLPTLTSFATNIGVNKDTFATCVNDKNIAKIVDEHVKIAVDSGAEGTPYNIIVDTKTGAMYSAPGAMDVASLRQIINEIMK